MNIAKTILVLALTLLATGASAGTLTVTCGKNAYEALEKKKLDMAEFSAVLKLKGLNNPPELKRLTDDGSDIKNSAHTVTRKVEDGVTEIKIEMNGAHRYEITGLKGCEKLDNSTGKVTYYKNRGGFAGVLPTSSATCNCVEK